MVDSLALCARLLEKVGGFDSDITETFHCARCLCSARKKNER